MVAHTRECVQLAAGGVLVLDGLEEPVRLSIPPLPLNPPPGYSLSRSEVLGAVLAPVLDDHNGGFCLLFIIHPLQILHPGLQERPRLQLSGLPVVDDTHGRPVRVGSCSLEQLAVPHLVQPVHGPFLDGLRLHDVVDEGGVALPACLILRPMQQDQRLAPLIAVHVLLLLPALDPFGGR